MKALAILLLLAAAGFFVLFSPWTKECVPFWVLMPVMAAFLAAASLYYNHSESIHRRDARATQEVYAFKFWHVAAGVVSAIVLYGVFWAGHFVSTRVLPFAGEQVESIYSIRAGQNPWVIAALLIFIIGPAEEIFWRGFVQGRLSNRYGIFIGFLIAAAIYALVHVWSFNFMLIAAAAICGGFWGLLFAFTRRLWPCIISHAIWDVLVFIVLPIS